MADRARAVLAEPDTRGSVPMSPPPPPPSPPARQPTLAGESTEAQNGRYRRELAILRPLGERVTELEEIVGRVPDPLVKGDKGGGIAGLSVELETRLDTLTAALDGLRASIDADRREREAARALTASAIERRREQPAKTGWAVLTAVLCFIAVGAVGSAGAYVALHWRTDVPAVAQPR